MYTERFTEVHYPLAVLHADSETTEQETAFVDVSQYHRLVALIDVGEMAATAKLNARLKQATAASGGTEKIIAGKVITELSQAAGDGNQLVAIELRAEELDVSGGFHYVQLVVTPSEAAVEFSAWLLGICPRYAPTPTTNWEEIVTYNET